MLRRIISIVLAVLGVVVIALAIASATVWRSSDAVTATLPGPPDLPLVVTDAGVLEMVADDVTVVAQAPDGVPLTLVVGRESDVAAWVADAAHLRVTGLASWTTLSSVRVEGTAEVLSPAGSDMWVVEVTGNGSATLEWTHPGGRWSLLAATDGTAPAPQVTLAWPQEVATPFLVPGIVAGSILLLGGLGLAGMAALERREIRRHDTRRAERSSSTGGLPAPGADPRDADEADSLAGEGADPLDDAPTVQVSRRHLRDVALAQAADPRLRPESAEGAPGSDVSSPPTGGQPAPETSGAATDNDGAPAVSPWRRAWGLRAGRETETARRSDAPRSEGRDDGPDRPREGEDVE